MGSAAIALFFFLVLSRPQVALFHTIAVADPLFAHGELEPEIVERRTTVLRSYERALRDAADIAAFPLYPYDLWRAIADVSTAHEAFVSMSDRTHAETLITTWNAAAGSYLESVTQRGQTLELLRAEKAAARPIVFPGGRFVVTLAALQHDNMLARNNAVALSRDVARRRCLLQRSFACMDEKIQLAVRVGLHALGTALPTPKFAPAPGMAHDDTLPLDIILPHARNIRVVSQPYEVETFCFFNFSKKRPDSPTPQSSHELVLVVTDIDDTGEEVRLAVPAAEAFYLRPGPEFRARALSGSLDEYSRYLAVQNWQGSFQLGTRMYMCPQFSHILAAFSYAAGGNGSDLAGLPDALQFVAERGLKFQVRYEEATGHLGTKRPSSRNLFLLAAKSPFDLNFFNHVPAIWRIDAQPQYVADATEIPEWPPIIVTTFRELTEQHGFRDARTSTASLKPQAEWLREFAASQPRLNASTSFRESNGVMRDMIR